MAYLDHDEACTAVVGAGKVDIGLVAGDVEALDGGRGDGGEACNRGEEGSKRLHDVDGCLNSKAEMGMKVRKSVFIVGELGDIGIRRHLST